MKLLAFGDVGHILPNLSTRTTPCQPIAAGIPEETL
jgi:hypothetical protein